MRINSTTKYFWLLIIALAVIVTLILYFILHYEYAAMIVGVAVMGIIACSLLYISIIPLLTALGEKSDNIMAVYKDASEKGLHIFSSYSTSGGRLSTMPLRTIQYYFLIVDSNKLLYKKLFSHFMKPQTGHSGYEGFDSFESSVINGPAFNTALADFSITAGWELQLGEAIAKGEKENYSNILNGEKYNIEKNKTATQDIFLLCSYDAHNKLVWSKKL